MTIKLSPQIISEIKKIREEVKKMSVKPVPLPGKIIFRVLPVIQSPSGLDLLSYDEPLIKAIVVATGKATAKQEMPVKVGDLIGIEKIIALHSFAIKIDNADCALLDARDIAYVITGVV